ncbi:hypothetical protein DSO57_1015803 [Entomophthora muscae]|uniref:Uncharacterized protein n=1 Tax=Entomophthora muscae TaxID=34485 RepID=A0ACC2U3R1_9FUNG|nr:hypothetical protein DSO57_1015803 [Entomophthora muscae]
MTFNTRQLHVARAIQLLRPFIKTQRYNSFLQVILQRTKAVKIVLENIQDPLNGSACLRTGDGYGLQYFDLIESVDNFKIHLGDKPYLGAATGVDKWVTLSHYKTAKFCLEDLKKENYVVLGSSLTDRSQLLTEVIKDLRIKQAKSLPTASDPMPLFEVPLPKLALVFGNEHRGISKVFQKYCDYIFKIPMYGFSQSFNINATVAMSLATLEQHSVMRKLGYKSPFLNKLSRDMSISHCSKATSSSNPNSIEPSSLAVEPTSFWPKDYNPNHLNHPLSLTERNELLLKWLFRTTPYSESLWAQNGINLDFL